MYDGVIMYILVMETRRIGLPLGYDKVDLPKINITWSLAGI